MGRSRKRGEARIPRMLINSLKTAFDQNRARTTTPSIHDGLQLDNCEGKEIVVEILRPIFPRFSPLSSFHSIPASAIASIFHDTDPFSRETHQGLIEVG